MGWATLKSTVFRLSDAVAHAHRRLRTTRKAKNPGTVGAQNVTRRKARTPATAGPAATPTPVSPATRAASTAPRAPGVGLTEATAEPPRYTTITSRRTALAWKAARQAARARALPRVTPMFPENN